MVVRLGDYIEEYSVRNKDSEDIPVYSVTNTQGFCQDYFGKEVASKDKSTYKIVPRGCFAYNPSRINVGSIDWQRNEERVIVSPLYNVFSVSPRLDQQYLYYFLKSDVALQRIKVVATGSVRDNLKFDKLCEFPINYVELDEQRVITHTLDKIKHLKELLQNEIDELDTLIKARFVEMFGDLIINPYGYAKYELRETCKVITGNTPSRDTKEYYGDFMEWIKTDNIVAGRTYPTKAAEFLSEEGVAVGRTVDEGAILMACIAGSVASIGRVCITDRKVAFNQQINAIVPRDYDTRFLYVMLQIAKEYLVEEINMSLKGILSKSKLEDKMFYIPPMDIQKEFSMFVQQVDKSKAVIQKALDETQLLFDSLMQEYFG